MAALPPVISGRDAKGLVTISNTGGGKMVFTVDGTAPKTNSPIYNVPFTPPPGGTVQAACVMPNGQLGIVASKSFGGLPPTGWKVVAVDSQETAGENNAATNAIDGNTSTFWHTAWNSDLALPHFITVDMGRSHRIAGFTYLPRQDDNPNGTVENYRFETSADGSKLDDQHRFGHVRQHSEQPVASGSQLCSRQRPVFPLHGIAGGQPKRMDECRRNLRLAGRNHDEPLKPGLYIGCLDIPVCADTSALCFNAQKRR